MNIVILGDNNIYYGIITLLNSIVKNNKNTKITFYLFLEKKKKFINKIKTFANTLDNEKYIFNYITLKDISLSGYPTVIEIYHYYRKIINFFKSINHTTNNYNLFNLCRLLLSELLPNVEECIYLDCDIIVRCDLSELYNLYQNIINEKQFFCAVKSIGNRYLSTTGPTRFRPLFMWLIIKRKSNVK